MSALLEPPPAPTVGPSLNSLRTAVTDFGRYRKRWAVLHAGSVAVLALPGALLLWFALDWLFKLPAWSLLGLFVIAFGGGLAVAIYQLIHPLRQRIEAEREALVIESLHGGLDNQI